MSPTLIPAIIQDADTRRVLMLAYMNDDALRLTHETGFVHFWSRSRNELWKKGETSGNVLQVVDLRTDCDEDTILVLARPAGPVCHTGSATCFDDDPPEAGFARLEALWDVIRRRDRERPAGSYTVALLEGGPDMAGRKVAEEAIEVLMAAKDHAGGLAENRRVAEEMADLVYHLLVLATERGIDAAEIMDVLSDRAR